MVLVLISDYTKHFRRSNTFSHQAGEYKNVLSNTFSFLTCCLIYLHLTVSQVLTSTTLKTQLFFFCCCLFIYFLMALGFELRASRLLGRHSTTWATHPAHFCVGYFPDRVLQTACLGWLWAMILLISASGALFCLKEGWSSEPLVLALPLVKP
jgi:hypothetical protein